jgi:putative ABC transport system permease protein
LEFVNNNLDFLLASTALNGLIKTCDAIFITVIALAAIILSLLVIYLMNDRLFEIGVLLSLGESRYRISAQMILEILMPALIAINIGALISSVIIPAVGKAVSAGMQIDQALTSTNVGALFLLANICGILLVVIASVIPMISIRKYTPKQIMQTFK